jgi:peptidoglycan/xylan/chitin deacetylase (PgdA/CDA1 family)
VTDVVVLCYHAVSARWSASLSVTPDALRRQLSSLVRAGWRGATFTEAVLDPPAARTVAVTFDDGFASVRELAAPILAELGLPATVFAPTAFIDEPQELSWPGIDQWAGTPDAAELRSMSWDDLRELSELGWEIGAHTRTHPRLTTLSDSDLREELSGSRESCTAHLGRPCRAVAYPYGDVDARVADAAREAGFDTGAALSSSLWHRGVLRWPRVGIYNRDGDARFTLKLNATMRRFRATRLWSWAP